MTGSTEMRMGAHQDAIRVISPRALGCDSLPAERVPLGEAGDYKPCIALLRNRELGVVAFHQDRLGGDKVREDVIWFTSTDCGRTWTKGQVLGILGREPYVSALSDGTLLVTTHLSPYDVRNQDGYIHSYIHRSMDDGATWETLKIGFEDVSGAPEKAWTHTSRNVLELRNGTLILGVCAPRALGYLWWSTDKGKTWDKGLACHFLGLEGGAIWWPFMGETFFWQAHNGDLLGVFRVVHNVFPPIPGTDIPQSESDQFGRMVVYRSKRGGRNWSLESEMGSYYGEMYPSILRIEDGRLLLTFTVREMRPPLGVHAVLGEEMEDGFRFDFGHDRLVLDEKTPVGMPSGGGFGPTVQLEDGTLVTAYSYRGADDRTHLEVVRWGLP